MFSRLQGPQSAAVGLGAATAAGARAALAAAAVNALATPVGPRRARVLEAVVRAQGWESLPASTLLLRTTNTSASTVASSSASAGFAGGFITERELTVLELTPGLPLGLCFASANNNSSSSSSSNSSSSSVTSGDDTAGLLRRASREHNVCVAAQLFTTASLARLATHLLGLGASAVNAGSGAANNGGGASSAAATATAALIADLVSRGAVSARLDEAAGFVRFPVLPPAAAAPVAGAEGLEKGSSSSGAEQSTAMHAERVNVVQKWREGLGALCEEVDEVLALALTAV